MRLLEDVARRGEVLTAVVEVLDKGRSDVVEAPEAAWCTAVTKEPVVFVVHVSKQQ
jgi:hypothetical protein